MKGHRYNVKQYLSKRDSIRHWVRNFYDDIQIIIVFLKFSIISIPNMFQQLPQTYIQRQLKTSEPRFKRLSRLKSPEDRANQTVHQNFPTVKRGYAFDNSKQNLIYETHLAKVRSACKLDETTIVSKYLNTIRKDYDQMSKVSSRELNSMKMKKREIDFIRQKNQVFTEKRVELEDKIIEREKEMNEIKEKYDDAKMQAKTLENIIVRMKKDQIFYKQFGRIRDEELKNKAKQVKNLDENLIHEDQKLHRLVNTLNQYKTLYHKNKDVREKKFEDFSGKIGDVRQRDRFIQERKERTYELQSIELNDTLDEKNIHMREIILAHKVADSLLESKVNTLIKKYSDIQGAFHLVKIKTGVNEPQLLTTKFFSYEQTSENLLESINDKEKYIDFLKEKKEDLIRLHKNLSNDHLSQNSQQTNQLFSANHPSWKAKITEQIYQRQLILDEIHNWINRKVHQLAPVDTQQTPSAGQKFQMICQFIADNIKKYENYEFNDQKVETMGVRMKKIVKQLSAQELSIRLRQTEDMNESNLAEQEYIRTSRQNIIKKAFNIKHIKRQSNK